MVRKNNVQYVIRRGIDDNIDYNNDGVIDRNDDIVVKYVNGKEVERKPLSKKVMNSMLKVIAKQNDPTDDKQRVVYQRMPKQATRTAGNTTQPSPVVVQNESSFGQYVKAGAGLTLGQMAVQGVASVLGGLFE